MNSFNYYHSWLDNLRYPTVTIIHSPSPQHYVVSSVQQPDYDDFFFKTLHKIRRRYLKCSVARCLITQWNRTNTNLALFMHCWRFVTGSACTTHSTRCHRIMSRMNETARKLNYNSNVVKWTHSHVMVCQCGWQWCSRQNDIFWAANWYKSVSVDIRVQHLRHDTSHYILRELVCAVICFRLSRRRTLTSDEQPYHRSRQINITEINIV